MHFNPGLSDAGALDSDVSTIAFVFSLSVRSCEGILFHRVAVAGMMCTVGGWGNTVVRNNLVFNVKVVAGMVSLEP